MQTVACWASVILASELLSIFLMKIIAAFFDFYTNGRQGDERGKERGGGGAVEIFSPFPSPTVYSNSKSNVAGRINDRELVTFTLPNKTPEQ